MAPKRKGVWKVEKGPVVEKAIEKPALEKATKELWFGDKVEASVGGKALEKVVPGKLCAKPRELDDVLSDYSSGGESLMLSDNDGPR